MDRPAALVTGGSSGIGLALAHELVRRGHPVVLVARDVDRLARAAAGLAQAQGATVTAVPLDLAAPDAAKALTGELSGRGLQIGILINNAAMFSSGDVVGASAGQVAEIVRLNVVALDELTRAFLPAMVARGEGLILNVGSLAGLAPVPGMAAYSASKAFVHSYSLALREELIGTGVKVSLLAPGFVGTGFATQERSSRLMQWIYRRATRPETVALCAYRGMMSGEPVIVPGLSGRLIWYTMGLIPARARARFVRWCGQIMRRASTPAVGADGAHADV